MNYSKSFNKILLQVNKRHLQLSRKQTSKAFDVNIRKKQSMLSLPSQILFKERSRKLSDIYKALSSEKAALNSTSKSKKKFQITPQKKKYQSPFKPFSNNITKNDNKQKLILQRTNQSSSFINTKSNHNDSHHIDLQIKLRVLEDKLEQLTRLKSNQNFKNQFKSFLSAHFEKENFNNHKQFKKTDLLYQSLSKLYKCFQRNSLAQNQQTNEIALKNKQLQEEITSLKIQLNKLSIKHVLYERNIEKEKQLTKKLQKQLISYRNKNKNIYISVGSNTNVCKSNDEQQKYNLQHEQDKEINQIGQGHNNGQQLINYQFKIKQLNVQLLKFHKVHAIQKKNLKQLIDVLVFLKKQGVDVQNIYDNVINGRIDGSASQDDGNNLKKTIKQLRDQQKHIYKKAKQMKANNSFDADNSIISSQQGLSFNYQQKSLQMQAYTLRREYKCKKQMPVDMKNRLKLNLNDFYDDGEDYQDQFQNQQEIEEIQTDNIEGLH